MKNTIYPLIALLLIFFAGCKTKESNTKAIKQDFNIDAAYLLLPIQDKSPEVKVDVTYPDSISQSPYFIRLAQDSIDYWVKLDVKNYKGKTVSLEFEGLGKNSFALKNIKQSDSFEFEYNEKYRPQFHFSPEYGWMNDPNGMVYLDGEYHLFYQYNPYGSVWGNMHWGHAVSTDLISWTYLPTVLTPDSLGAIFSGSAVIDVNNTAGFGKNAMVAIYTSAGKVQAQSIAYSTDRGRTFTKYTKNPVLPNPGITDFRDPKVSWNEQTKQWVMALATKQTITFYGSPDLKNWSKLSEFGNETGAHGGVWECPDLFPLTYEGKTKWVLLVSINPGGPNGGSATQYFIGNFDGKTFKADNLPYPLWVDYGRDNYAGVTFSNIQQTDGRRIFIGWMSNWDYANDVPTKGFRSAMTVARELILKSNGKHLILTNTPTREVTALRGKVKSIENQSIHREKTLNDVFTSFQGKYEFEMTIERQNSKIWGFGLTNADGDYLNFTFDLEQNLLKVDRRNCGLSDFSRKYVSEPIAPLATRDSYKIRLLIDKASSEIFINDGETVMTNIVFPTQNYNNLTFFALNQSWEAKDIKIYAIN